MDLRIPVSERQFYFSIWIIVAILSGYGLFYEYDHKILFVYQKNPNFFDGDSMTPISLITALVFGFDITIGLMILDPKLDIKLPQIHVRFKA